MSTKLRTEFEEAAIEGSGWSLSQIMGIRVRVNWYDPLYAGSYIPLPVVVATTKSCINVQNTDNRCFAYAVLSPFVTPTNSTRASACTSLLKNGPYNFNTCTFPMAVADITAFERSNDISINVYGLDRGHCVYPLKVVEEEKADHRDILIVNKGNNARYVYIKNFSRLMAKQFTTHNGQLYVCKRCFSCSNCQQKLQMDAKTADKALCSKNKCAKIEMPSAGSTIRFNNHQKTIRVPCIMYADFESIILPEEGPTRTRRHKPISVVAHLVSDHVITADGTLAYVGEDAASHFVRFVVRTARAVSTAVNRHPNPVLTHEQADLYSRQNTCHICNREFDKGSEKVRDHDHLTGEYRGAAHGSCNVRARKTTFLPVLLRNMSGYDAHLFLRELTEVRRGIEIISTTRECYIAIRKFLGDIEIRFLDSYRFLSASLDSLAQTINTNRFHPILFPNRTLNCSNAQLALLQRKGFFPYEWFDTKDKLDDTQLPHIDSFYSSLTNCTITQTDYQHSIVVWDAFRCSRVRNYLLLYNACDVALLAECFEAFRSLTLATHSLDPLHYYTTPGLTWDAMLKFTGVDLEMIHDYDMILMFEQGIRGRLCQVTHRHANADNGGSILYLDANNLYGHVMCSRLPVRGFEWVTTNFDVETIRRYIPSDR